MTHEFPPDTGCDVSPSCLNCPLEVCIEDLPMRARSEVRQAAKPSRKYPEDEYWRGRDLTAAEVRILRALMDSGGQYVSSVDISRIAYGEHSNPVLLRAHIYNLRGKLRRMGLGNAIQTVHKRGYRWAS